MFRKVRGALILALGNLNDVREAIAEAEIGDILIDLYHVIAVGSLFTTMDTGALPIEVRLVFFQGGGMAIVEDGEWMKWILMNADRPRDIEEGA